MKLYYSPGACSQAPHILLHEIGLSHDAAKVDLRSKMVEDGRSYLQVNPKGSVPALELNNGEVLTENAIVLQYLGDRAGSDVLPPVGDFRRYRVLEMVNFITTELHKSFAPLFKPNAGEETKRFYRDVIRELKKQQLVGDAILPFYENRLHQIEKIIVDQKLVTLPDRPARIRIATAAETAQQPAPHMQPPPFLHNTGQKGEFVLPLNIPATGGKAAEQYDDFTYDAAAWTLTAHEARPGHELQFDSMLEHGVSLARVRYAMNSTNAEGWGLYSEYLVKPFMPPEGQLVSLDLRLQRAARAFLDPELQAGKITTDEAYRVLQNDVVLSHAMAQQEVERYTYRSPGQATSYFYGYTRLLELRKDVEAALGSKFDALKFHDFILAQGLLPPDLMREAVMKDFVPAQRGQAH